jgi:hypothetical protein
MSNQKGQQNLIYNFKITLKSDALDDPPFTKSA